MSPTSLRTKQEGIIQDFSCVTKTEEWVAWGYSLFSYIRSRETVIILSGQYNCNVVDSKDIFVHYYAGDKNPLIKIIKGIPEDI